MIFNFHDKDYDISTSNCFEPNLTTKLFAESAEHLINASSIRDQDILEIGCGSGVLTIILNDIHPNNHYYLSDLHEESIKTAISNLKKYNSNAKILKSNCFDSWDNYKFDLIINDISGISEDIASVSEWFKNAPAKTGRSGNELTEKILKSAKKFFKNENSKLLFPVLSLSNSEKIINSAEKNFKSVSKVASKDWPLPKDLYKHLDVFKGLATTKDCSFEEKFGMIICNTTIYLAEGPL